MAVFNTSGELALLPDKREKTAMPPGKWGYGGQVIDSGGRITLYKYTIKGIYEMTKPPRAVRLGQRLARLILKTE